MRSHPALLRDLRVSGIAEIRNVVLNPGEHSSGWVALNMWLRDNMVNRNGYCWVEIDFLVAMMSDKGGVDPSDALYLTKGNVLNYGGRLHTIADRLIETYVKCSLTKSERYYVAYKKRNKKAQSNLSVNA